VQTAALEGQALPGGIGSLGALPALPDDPFRGTPKPWFVLGPDGQIAFLNSFTSSGGTQRPGAFLAREDGTLEKIIAAGDPVPGTGGSLVSLGQTLAVDMDGQLVFSARASGGAANQAILLAPLETAGSQETTTSLVSSLDPSLAGQPVQLTAVVAASGSGTPTGTVSFAEDGTLLGSAPLNGGGQAAFSTSSLAAGSHSIIAQYGGDADFAPSASGSLMQAVNLRQTSAALASSINPAVGGQSVTFTATVTSAAGGTPSGTVRFLDNGTEIGSAVLDGSGQTAFVSSSLALGFHPLTAQYAGDSIFAAGGSATVTQEVRMAGFAPVSGPLTVSAGQTLSIPLTLFAAPGSGLSFTLTVAGVPANASAGFSANPVTPAAPPAGTTIQLIVATQAGSAAAPPMAWPWVWPAGPIALVLATLVALQVRPGALRGRLVPATGLATLLLCALFLGCSGSGSTGTASPTPATPKGPAMLTVTAASGSTTVSTDVPIVVQ
jgi:hypothetical protein